MVETGNQKDRNLKNVKQIGTPREENKIYIENMAYNKMKEEGYREKRVFVLMGHTERMEGKYATFIEAAIPVREIEFMGHVPRWNNSIWSEVFREIRRLYEDMIIVGWALDLKGMAVKMTPDLERVHREHFGGVHQLLFLLDTLDHEEMFYIYKENKVVPKDGFYIYHKVKIKECAANVPMMEEKRKKEYDEIKESFRKVKSEVEVELENVKPKQPQGGRYRALMQETQKPKKDAGNIGIAVAAAVLVFVIGVGVYENAGNLLGKQNSIETNLLQNATEDTETDEYEIEVEVIPGKE